MRIARALVLALTVGAAACGGHHPPATGPGGGAAGAGGGSGAGPVAGSGAAPGSAATPAPGAGSGAAADDSSRLSRDECVAMLNHVLDLQVAEKRRTVSAEDAPTDEEIATIRAGMIAELTDSCLRLRRADWRCAMDATDVAAFRACAQRAAETAPPATAPPAP
jgi:hypothetical protein